MIEVERDGEIQLIRFADRVNLLSIETLNELKRAVLQADMDESISAIVVSMTTLAGANLKELLETNTEEGIRWLETYWSTLSTLRETGKLVVAAIKGDCVAGGNELVMMCDLAVAAKSARFGQPEIIVGSTAMGGGLQMLPLLVGEKRARELAFTARLLSAEEALEWGLINRVVDGDVEEEAKKLALEVVERSSPQAFRVMKSCLNYWTNLAMLNWQIARDLTAFVWNSEEFKERGKDFLEKKKLKKGRFWRLY
ncbi:MAG: enoyl-CoA hydratase/isomerase family protein [Archaeoglobus sp.]|nr:enoyl-CoA hydratase/isomerase family protein [Archaeoglobus sp.]